MAKESSAPRAGVCGGGWAAAQGLGRAPDVHGGGLCDAQLLPQS